jgi:2-polyprenyl-6-methoxyphenol hydroxylase-like FAD-dependent oxidoreductase
MKTMTNANAILIVGAGPTGLTLANDLARRKVPFKIIDAKPCPSIDSKGLAINISSQYGFKLIGLNDVIGAGGKTISRLNLYWHGKKYSAINFKHLKSKIRSLITQPQSTTENRLLLALEEAGHKVFWSHKLIDLNEQNHQVQTKISDHQQNIAEEKFLYVVGCDGKYSRTRSHLETTFLGEDYDMHFVLGDFELDLNMSEHEVQYYIYADTFFILIPIAHNTWRIVVKYDGGVPEQPASANEIRNIIARHFGNDFTLGEPIWISRAPFYNRVAGKLNSDRVFIAGDAAHLFSPLGGTGMNTGIQDALNLGWKLAYVYHGLSRPGLLNSYEKERLPAIQEAAGVSDLSTQLITRKISDHPTLDKLAPLLANRNYLRSVAPYLHSGIAQKTAVPSLNTANISKHSELGKLSRILFYLLDNNKIVNNISITNDRFWCFISLDAIQDLATDSTYAKALSKRILHYPNASIYYYSSGPTQTFSCTSSDREQFVNIPASFSQGQSNLNDIAIVRPDGLVVYESDLDSCIALEDAIDANFHFLKECSNQTMMVEYEKVY